MKYLDRIDPSMLRILQEKATLSGIPEDTFQGVCRRELVAVPAQFVTEADSAYLQWLVVDSIWNNFWPSESMPIPRPSGAQQQLTPVPRSSTSGLNSNPNDLRILADAQAGNVAQPTGLSNNDHAHPSSLPHQNTTTRHTVAVPSSTINNDAGGPGHHTENILCSRRQVNIATHEGSDSGNSQAPFRWTGKQEQFSEKSDTKPREVNRALKNTPPGMPRNSVPLGASHFSDQYSSLEKEMEHKAMAGGFRKEFFITLQKRREEANRNFKDCSRHYRQWYAQRLVWEQWFPRDQFPGTQPLPYERNWGSILIDKARNCVAVAPPPLRNPRFPVAVPILNRGLPCRSEAQSPQRRKEPDLRSPQGETSSRNVTANLSFHPSSANAKVSRGGSGLSQASTHSIASAIARTPISKRERGNIEDRLLRGDFYTPSGSALASHGDYYRPEYKESEPMDQALKNATPSQETLPLEPKACLSASKEWNASGKRPIPKDLEYGRLHYEDETDLGETSFHEKSSPILNRSAKTDINAAQERTAGSKHINLGPPAVIVNGHTILCKKDALEKLLDIFIADTASATLSNNLHCHLLWQRIESGELSFLALPFLRTDFHAAQEAAQFLEEWVVAALQDSNETLLKRWSTTHAPDTGNTRELASQSLSVMDDMGLSVDVQHDTSIDTGLSRQPASSENSRTSATLENDYRLLFSEEAAKAEGGMRLVVDDETGTLVTLKEYKKRTLQRAQTFTRKEAQEMAPSDTTPEVALKRKVGEVNDGEHCEKKRCV
ncbi:hypothetical protein BP6252_06953 [Coleophoma cylindrospora]|uniref:Uncharacterized protein n=1 Tax=Coleophoma cylindrospora TaxID=1849047 RepID=A0A3D8RGG0_9HELO|nr:hypothetical protein BP6252_06953 [Coleophoma cylindrospora]